MSRQTYHFIGLEGVGMSALAHLLLEKGKGVQGSDKCPGKFCQKLQEKGAQIFSSHESKNISGATCVVYSSAITEENPEMIAAKKTSLPLFHRSDLLLELTKGKKCLSVTGTHGKTTTTSLLSYVLVHAGMDPSMVIGGVAKNMGHNSKLGKGDFFVAEADESDGSFLKLDSFGAIVTNAEEEHMDYWKEKSALISAFSKFCDRVQEKNLLFYCYEDPVLRSLHPKGFSYGFSKEADLYVYNTSLNGFTSTFSLSFQGKNYENISLSLSGSHNVLNAAAVFGLSLKIGIDPTVIKEAFKNFEGVQRRMDRKKEINNILFIDDYAHHPTEIDKTLSALRHAVTERKVIALFQPHRYSRFTHLYEDFLSSFSVVDELVVTDVYSAGESKVDVDMEGFIKKLKKKKISAQYIPTEKLVSYFAKNLKPHDVLIALGAGSSSSILQEIINSVEKNPPKMKIALVFGSRSTEHTVSLSSARNIFYNLDRSLYDPSCFYIDKKGRWHQVTEPNAELEKKLFEEEEIFSQNLIHALTSVDICFPVLHGCFGEDGMIQGFFETLGLPYIGCDYFSSSLCMDKEQTKRLARDQGVLIAPYVSIHCHAWKNEKEKLLLTIERTLQFPLYVKPAHLGSSIGVQRVETLESLQQAIESALLLDHEVLVEKEIVGKEIEFAIYGSDYLTVALPSEILKASDALFYDYDKKYGANATKYKIPPDISKEKISEGMELAKKAYRIMKCSGMCRVDFFLDEQNNYILNELNTIPGFTPTSLFAKMFEVGGMQLDALIHQMVISSLYHGRKMKRLYV